MQQMPGKQRYQWKYYNEIKIFWYKYYVGKLDTSTGFTDLHILLLLYTKRIAENGRSLEQYLQWNLEELFKDGKTKVFLTTKT